MTDTLVDTNILLDVVGRDPSWFEWSRLSLAKAADVGWLVVNPVVYSELAGKYRSRDELDEMLDQPGFRREHLSRDAAFAAGVAYVQYRRNGGARTSPLPDFFIGAHAATRGYRLLTRDRGYYARYFPTVAIISPEPLS
ncbi:type II toxin-antitoxin system VapC family toxin [Prosthecomicrobium pneumaticum]|uniref:PIN domain-containing protein n=1 Tax=Prosthecomicrobium pneumaticum TaxID=81895 RepID=A0A7W9CW17_9HYPH|nr:type II toxin-antitoxin system VapC family toxin [Prosthecomicrobium pneumaticum]MBB5752611.1 hypothetical protein [Prosthecomicrobium pneumaticum]